MTNPYKGMSKDELLQACLSAFNHLPSKSLNHHGTRASTYDLASALDDVVSDRPAVKAPTLTTNDKEAVALGFAGFNTNPHMCIDTADYADEKGNLTVSLRLADGQQATFAVMPKSHCIDVQLNSKKRHPKRPDLPTFHMIGFGPGTGDPFDTRTVEKETGKLLTLATILLDK